MERSLPPLIGILVNLALSLVLFNWLTCRQEVLIGALSSVSFFLVSTSVLAAMTRVKRKKKHNDVSFDSSSNEGSLKEQLRSCLQYGDVEKADQISLQLLSLQSATKKTCDGAHKPGG